MSEEKQEQYEFKDPNALAIAQVRKPQNENAIVKRKAANELQTITTPNIAVPKKKLKKTILEEDDYVDVLDNIIQRDYFPDLPKLRTHLEWLEAEERKDFAKMREIQLRLRKETEKTPIVLATPTDEWGMETPVSFTPADAPEETPEIRKTYEVIPGKRDPSKDRESLGVDQFLALHTSEDNASFENVMDKQEKAKKLHLPWLYDKEEEKLLLTGPNSGPGTVETWKFKAKNQLMYVPEGSALTIGQEKEIFKGPPKQIVRSNTRLRVDYKTQVESWKKGQQDDDRIDLDKLRTEEVLPGDTPKVGGYGFMATPSPAPGVDASPFTTWGSIEGTPLMLDPPDTPYSSHSGPSFSMQESSQRERVAQSLTEKTNTKLKGGTLVRTSKVTQSPFRQTPRTPSSLDQQLRASYRSPVVRGPSTPGRFSRTPRGVDVTPSPLPVRTPRSSKG